MFEHNVEKAEDMKMKLDEQANIVPDIKNVGLRNPGFPAKPLNLNMNRQLSGSITSKNMKVASFVEFINKYGANGVAKIKQAIRIKAFYPDERDTNSTKALTIKRVN